MTEASEYPHATHPAHWERHGHAGKPCPTDGSCYGGADMSSPPGPAAVHGAGLVGRIDAERQAGRAD